MLRLSQTTGYAIKSMGCLSEATDHCLQTAEIAARAGIPKPYLVKIVQSLALAGLVTAKRGSGGGIALVHPPEEVSLLRVVEAVEGAAWLGDCLLGLDDCTDLASCPTHDFWQRIRKEIIRQLEQTSLASIIAFRSRARRVAGIAATGRGSVGTPPPSSRARRRVGKKGS